MLEVAIVGAGAAGLAVARHMLLQTTGVALRPVLIDAAAGPGGAWASNNNVNGKMWTSMTTNLSRYTCRYSDFEWGSIPGYSHDDLQGNNNNNNNPPPLFPTASEMHTYLQAYHEDTHCLLPGADATFQWGCSVDHLSWNASPSSSNSKEYTLEWTSRENGKQHQQDFDAVVLATGFFQQPLHPPNLDIQESFQGTYLHSCEYKNANDFTNQTIVVIGCSFSAVEIAADLARTASKVIHVISSKDAIPWILPRHVAVPSPLKESNENQRRYLLPVDMALYQRQSSQQASIEKGDDDDDDDDYSLRVEALQKLVGGKQDAIFDSVGVFPDPQVDQANKENLIPPKVAISDDYLNLVQSGHIEILHGRATKAHSRNRVTITRDPREGGPSFDLEGIDTILACTGYRPNLETFVDSKLLEVLQYDPTDSFAPLTLAWDAIHPQIPRTFGCCGMYKGASLGVMDLQARLLAGQLSGSLSIPDKVLEDAYQQSQTLRKIPTAKRPQFPRWKTIEYMDELANVLGITPQYKDKLPFVSPAFYQTDPSMADKEASEMIRLVSEDDDASSAIPRKDVAQILLRAMVGTYTFERTIRHFQDPSRKESVSGTIQYKVRPKDDCVLYREDGMFALTPTKTLQVFREYEYLVNPTSGDMEIYFVENGERAHLFLSLQFSSSSSNDEGYWVATSDHLCIQDLYQGNFQVKMVGSSVEEMIITYRVKGPQKDYESVTHMFLT